MKRLILILFLTLLTAGIAYATDLGPVGNPWPTIKVDYNESVTITDYNLVNSSGESKALLDNSTDPNNQTFIYKAAELLTEGDYVFNITAEDTHGNSNTTTYTFTIVIEALNITLIKPEYRIAPFSPVEVMIRTERDVLCKHSTIPLDIENAAMKSFNHDAGSLLHNTSLNFGTNLQLTFYVKCNDTFRGEIASEQFELELDNTIPLIMDKYAEPSTLIESFETALFVTTNEDTVCKYGTGTVFSSMDTFPGFEEKRFNTTHTAPMTLISPPDGTQKYNLICMNRAGHFTNGSEDYIDIEVNSGLPLDITVNTPSALSSADVVLNLTTNRRANCFYSDDAEISPDIPFVTVYDDIDHINPLSGLTSGIYDYYFKCISFTTAGEETESLHLTIDTTPPTMLFVNDSGPIAGNPGITYYTDRLEAKWLAYDNETGIEEYEYSIYMYSPGGNVLIHNDTTPDDNVLAEDLTLSNAKKYFFSVRAKNPAGRWSSVKNSDGITVDNTTKPATCGDEIKNSGETDVDCGGSCPKCGKERVCDIDNDCLTGYCSLYSVCALPSCNDTEKNGNETGIDCGGSCEACGADGGCQADSDCISGNCVSNKCTEPDTCNNDQLDEDETDFDCGGSCERCESGKQCKVNSDCIDGFCKSSICVEPSCDDGELNQGEADTDCGGPCTVCEISSSCKLNSDCKSGNCEENICVEPLDSDGDGLPNDWEKMYELDPNNKDTDDNGILDPDEDMDADGLTNLEEWQSGYAINPRNPDTDSDGYSDKEEIDAGTDPTDPDSHPGFNFFLIIALVVVIGGLGAGGYFGYKFLMERKEKLALTRKAPPKPAAQPRARPAAAPPRPRPDVHPGVAHRIPSKAALQRKEEERKKIIELEQKRKEKERKREKLFEAFGGKGTAEIKKEKPKPKEIKKHIPAERVRPVVKPPKKPVMRPAEKPMPIEAKPKEKPGNVFDRLGRLSRQELGKPAAKRDVFKHLSNTLGKEVKEDTFNKLTELVKSDKVKRKDMFDTIHHISKRGSKEFTKKASKHMLSHLINTKKSNKAHVTDVLHSLKERRILSEDDTSEIMGHIEKHEKKKKRLSI